MFNRRQFLSAVGIAAASREVPGLGGMFSSLLAARTPAGLKKAFGSGYFGEWIDDENGLPTYHYTCNQLTDPKAITPVNKVWRAPTDHTHQVGNDRLVAAVSNYGYVQVRQDEGGPKFLNDYFPEGHLYGGGLGYLTDDQTLLSTYYPGNADTFDRIFGMGYLRKILRGTTYGVDQVIFAPFGDDPLLISRVTIQNSARAPVDLRWVEYWGCQVYQLSCRSLMLARMQQDLGKAAALRRKFGERFEHSFRALNGGVGLLETKRFLARTTEDEQA